MGRALRGVLRGLLTVSVAVGVTGGAADCYSTGDGTPPPLDEFYFPVGLQVSAGGTVLYAINSDFDLQYNGGTLQSYDLGLIRRHTLDIIHDSQSAGVPILDRDAAKACPDRPDPGQTLGQTCAPPVDSRFYVRDSAVIGAFATDLVLSLPPARLVPRSPRAFPGDRDPDAGTRAFDRLFAPVRGNASITWANVERDRLDSVPPPDPKAPYGPYVIQCGKDGSGRCDAAHTAGEDADEQGNTRRITMPGEPFGMAVSEDGESIVVTHQNETKTSLFSTGLARDQSSDPGATPSAPPSLQFILEGVPFGGVGLASIPHDRDAFTAPATVPQPAFLETSRVIAEVSLIRRYPDEFGGVGSAMRRPFLDREASFPVRISAGGTDSRGLAIDPTPRLECKARVEATKAGRPDADVQRDIATCARKAARVFIANRTPAALLVGDLGGSASSADAYDPDRLVLHTTIPLSAGPSKVYLAPIVDRDGAFALRVFVVCFDSATVFVIDPATLTLENVIRVGLGPFAMAFDPFTFEDVAAHVQVPLDPRDGARGLRSYRFAYLASFTNSFVQVIDLDDTPRPDRFTYERVVFTLGRPTAPKGS